MDLTLELTAAKNLAKRAGEMALELRGKLVINEKPHGEGPVTNADIAIDQFICQELLKKFPDDDIVSEEGLSPRNFNIDDGRVWFVDPIDGTASYIMGDDDFVVMIGLAIDGIARLGVVLQPTMDTMWWGISDGGPAYKKSGGQTKSLNASQKKQPEELKVIVSRTHRSRKQDAMVAALKPKHILYRSSIGLKAMLITEGIADLYVAWSRRIKRWDTCAPTAIIKAAGGYVSDLNDKDLTYHGPLNHGVPVLFASFKPSEELFGLLGHIEDH